MQANTVGWHQLTAWGSLTGPLLLTHPATHTIGALILNMVGWGGLGVAWTRACDADLRRWRHTRREHVECALAHLPFAIVGTWALTLQRKAVA